jgi:uncharacterized membrane protein
VQEHHQTITQNVDTKAQVFRYRLDFYWQAIAFYAIALLLYAVLKGSISAGTLTIALYDPIVLLLGAVVCGSVLVSLANSFMHRSVSIDGNSISFHNRFRTRTFTLADIRAMSIGKAKMVKVRGVYKVVKIRLVNRRRILRLRPSLYENEQELVQALIAVKRNLLAQLR